MRQARSQPLPKDRRVVSNLCTMRHARRRFGLPMVVSLLLAAVLLVGAVTGFLLFSSWIRSEECHALLEKKVSKALGGKAQFGPIEWLWVGVASPHVTAVSGDGARPHTIEAGDLRARLRLSSLLQGFWAIEEISMERTSLHFAAAVPATAKKNASPAPTEASPKRLPLWAPSVLVVEAVRCGNTDLLFDLPEGKMLELLGTKLEVFPGKEDARIEAHGGRMLWTRFPEFHPNLLWARGRFRNGRLRLNGAELALANGGSASFEGEFPDPTGTSRIDLHCKGFPIGEAFPAAKASLGGTLSGEGRATWTPSELLTMEGRIFAQDSSVHGVPVLDELAAFTGMEQFRNLSLKKASASFSKSGSVTRWREILLEAPGVLKVTGDADVGDNGSLSGTFQAGITTDIVRVIPMVKELLSAEERDGYFWMPVHIAGTLDRPTEDLQPRLVTAIATKASGVIRGGIDLGIKVLGIKPGDPASSDAAGAATNAVKTLEKNAGSVLDAVGGFLK